MVMYAEHSFYFSFVFLDSVQQRTEVMGRAANPQWLYMLQKYGQCLQESDTADLKCVVTLKMSLFILVPTLLGVTGTCFSLGMNLTEHLVPTEGQVKYSSRAVPWGLSGRVHHPSSPDRWFSGSLLHREEGFTECTPNMFTFMQGRTSFRTPFYSYPWPNYLSY